MAVAVSRVDRCRRPRASRYLLRESGEAPWRHSPEVASSKMRAAVPGDYHLHTWVKGVENFSNHPPNNKRLHRPRHGSRDRISLGFHKWWSQVQCLGKKEPSPEAESLNKQSDK
ncbi:hypothetical protein EJB05_29463 [Eragrostis curvula]|uniref:Uncharacterized protein n=1 Tax=Eragrostis curvula TaxID=38414 RepID=A0A5J9USU2_9POAL|nr:hypothetical protein EJB05_29463 [Eragrostis curvula]